MKPEYDAEAMTSITPAIDAAIGEAITEVLEDWGGSYNLDPITDLTFERNEYEAYSGYIPFQNGGFNTVIVWPYSLDSSHRPSVFDTYCDLVQSACQEDYEREFPGRLTAMDQHYSEYEDEYTADACPGVQIEISYYGADNGFNPIDEQSVSIRVLLNTDGPYYRKTAGERVGAAVCLPASTPDLAKEVASKLKSLLEELK